MTLPLTLPRFDRLNMGGAYVVTVCERRRLLAGTLWAGKTPVLQYMAPQEGPGYGRIHFTAKFQGTVSSDGSLSVEPEPWAARHYRRAVMRGAGVYRWGLWAMLAPGRASAEPDAQAEAALNGAAQLDGFSPWGVAPLPLPTGAVFYTSRHMALALPDDNRSACTSVRRADWSFANLEALSESLWAIAISLEVPKNSRTIAGIFKGLAYKTASHVLPQGYEGRAQRRAFWGSIRRILRVLRRMLPRVRRPRSTRPAPRPLHARPRPPAAPLAPPALA